MLDLSWAIPGARIKTWYFPKCSSPDRRIQMSNGDPLAVGITQPPFNRATAGTMLVHDGSPFGTQSTAFWVKRTGHPHCDAAIRGENFALDPDPDRMQTGVLGMIPPDSGGVGVIGTASAGTGPS